MNLLSSKGSTLTKKWAYDAKITILAPYNSWNEGYSALKLVLIAGSNHYKPLTWLIIMLLCFISSTNIYATNRCFTKLSLRAVQFGSLRSQLCPSLRSFLYIYSGRSFLLSVVSRSLFFLPYIRFAHSGQSFLPLQPPLLRFAQSRCLPFNQGLSTIQTRASLRFAVLIKSGFGRRFRSIQPN